MRKRESAESSRRAIYKIYRLEREHRVVMERRGQAESFMTTISHRMRDIFVEVRGEAYGFI